MKSWQKWTKSIYTYSNLARSKESECELNHSNTTQVQPREPNQTDKPQQKVTQKRNQTIPYQTNQ